MKSVSPITYAGVGILCLGVAIGFFFLYPTTWRYADVIHEFYANVSTELISIAITVLFIDYLYKRREDSQLKSRLIWEMGSSDRGFAVRATKELRAQGWLCDGSLRSENFELANLEGADLRDANLEGCVLNKANLKDAHLEKSFLRKSNLKDAIFYNAHLEEADLQEAKLNRARLHEAYLEKTLLSKADLLGAFLKKAELRGAILSQAGLEETDLTDADLSYTNLTQTRFLRANLSGAILRNANLERADLSEVKNWKQINSIEGANISGVMNPPDGFLEWANEQGAAAAGRE